MAFMERKDFGVAVAGEKASSYDEFITLSQLVAGSNINLVRLANKDVQINATAIGGASSTAGNLNLKIMTTDVSVNDFIGSINHYMLTGTGQDGSTINNGISEAGSSYNNYGSMMFIDITHNFDLSDIDNFICYSYDITAIAGIGFSSSRIVMNKVVPVDENTIRIWARRTGDNSLAQWKANNYYNIYNYDQRIETDAIPMFRITILGGK